MAKTKQELKYKIDYLQGKLYEVETDYAALSKSYDALSILYRGKHAQVENIAAAALELLKVISV